MGADGDRVELRADRVVAAPAAAVWDVVADLSRRPDWLTEVRQVDDGSGTARAGTRFTGRAALLGHRFLGHGVVQEADPGRSLVEEIVLGARVVSRWAFEPAPGGATRVVHVLAIDFPAGPLGRLERWVLARRLRRMQRTSLVALGAAAGDRR